MPDVEVMKESAYLTRQSGVDIVIECDSRTWVWDTFLVGCARTLRDVLLLGVVDELLFGALLAGGRANDFARP